ncbi:MAG TPA: hypothetical protein VGK32_19965 [Vicinamibacterales bacterium]|jgi:hypothetical protein
MFNWSSSTASVTGEGAARPGARRIAWGRELVTLALFVLLAVAHTWPLASAPNTWCRNDNGDAGLNEWALAWVAHQVVRDPVHLFDANIFYPERRTLAFSEHLLPEAALVAPLLWGGGSPVLAHNVALLAGFVLTGWAMCFVVRRWTGSLAAGLVAGSLAAFNAHTLTRLANLQAQHVQYLPLALLALDRLLDSPRVRHALALAAYVTLQVLSSSYFLLFTVVTVAASSLVRPGDWLGARFRRVAPLLLLAVLVAVLALLPVIATYWLVRQEQGFVRTMKDVRTYSAIWTDYLATGALVHWGWSGRFFRGNGYFQGFTALGLAGLCLVTGTALKDRRARMCLAAALAAFVLSFGSQLPFYEFLFNHVPLFDTVRSVDRFAQVTILGVAALAGFGVAWCLRKATSRRQALILAFVLLAAVNIEAWRGPLTYTRFEGLPRVLRSLAGAPGAVVVYFPYYHRGGEAGLNSRFMLWSTLNWRPMLNGYSGFMPASFHRTADAVGRFPDAASLGYLQSVGVTHIVVDGANMNKPQFHQVTEAEGLKLWASDGTVFIYTIR